MPVVIYNGQLDLICCTLGVDLWLDKLQWEGLPAFQALRPQPVHSGKTRKTTAFTKQHQNLVMYTVLDAGHMVPADQPKVALDMVSRIIEVG